MISLVNVLGSYSRQSILLLICSLKSKSKGCSCLVAAIFAKGATQVTREAEAVEMVVEVGSAQQFVEHLGLKARSPLVVQFWMLWTPQSMQMCDVIAETAKRTPSLSICEIGS